jgi:outer membrane protein TolC
VSVEECVRFALEKNFAIRIADASESAAIAQLAKEKAAFDPVIGGSVVNSRPPGGDWTGLTGSAGLSKKFLTGAELNVAAGDVFPNTGDFRDDYLNGEASDVTLSLRQPLLRGAWGVNRSGIKLASLLKDQASAIKIAEVLDTLRSGETAYWTAAVAREMVQRRRHTLQRAEKLRADVKARLDAGDASKLDELEVQVALAGAQERLVAAERAAADRLDELWFVLGVPVQERRNAVTFQKVPGDVADMEKPDPEASAMLALTRAPASVLLINEVQRREVAWQAARNGLLPQVDLELAAERTNGQSSASSSSSDGSGNYDAVALLRVSIPLGFRAERAEVKRAQAELERSQAAREQAELRLRQRIAELCRALESGREGLRVAKISLDAHAKKLDEQMRRHAEGLLTTHDVRIAQEELENAELRELQARLSLLADRASLGQLDGTLAERHGIDL